MRTVFLGTSDFAAAVLGCLAASEHRPALVLTRPDRPRGRGRRSAPPPVADAARKLGLPLEQPEQINDPAVCALAERAAGAEAVLVVCAFGALIKEPLLSAFTILNVHPSLLPRWRGAAPLERAIMAGDPHSGVSIMRLTAGLDSGPVCAVAEEAIAPQDTYGSLAERLRRLGGELLVQVLDEWERGRPPRFAEQPQGGVTYAEKIGPEDRLLDPALSAAALERRVRALHPHVGARVARADGTLLGVSTAALATGDTGSVPAGTLVAIGDPPARLLYGTRAGALELLAVQPPGGRPMDAAAYLRGHAL
ncbi:MAG TPA: methionyl-tRNA formyltransferase [Solirubrobacteraceae bacterium]|nr:methionyl-tRNA formyltransferase [Solirubrobacteraceae bacterium]